MGNIGRHTGKQPRPGRVCHYEWEKRAVWWGGWNEVKMAERGIYIFEKGAEITAKFEFCLSKA
jgi:hypothetical protein